MSNEPRTLVEAIRYFSDPDVALAQMVEFRWPHGVICPTCGRDDAKFLPTRRLWECKSKHPRKQFSIKHGTIMEDSALGIDIWFIAIWSIANDKNGISSYEFARMTGITQKSAWHVLHRVRLAMKVGGFEKLGGTVEIDETWIGGKAKNMHSAKLKRNEERSGSNRRDMTVVMGMLQRSVSESALSHVRLHVVPGIGAPVLKKKIRDHVALGAMIHTDSLPSYSALYRDGYAHESVNHKAEEYVRGNVHTNGIENFWSCLKRTLGGTYISVEPFHLVAYLDEQCFRFNERKGSDADRFRKLASSITGLKLTWKELTGVADAGQAA